jgi:hypothetical protein
VTCLPSTRACCTCSRSVCCPYWPHLGDPVGDGLQPTSPVLCACDDGWEGVYCDVPTPNLRSNVTVSSGVIAPGQWKYFVFKADPSHLELKYCASSSPPPLLPTSTISHPPTHPHTHCVLTPRARAVFAAALVPRRCVSERRVTAVSTLCGARVTSTRISQSNRAQQLVMVGRSTARSSNSLATVIDSALFDFKGFTARADTQVVRISRSSALSRPAVEYFYIGVTNSPNARAPVEVNITLQAFPLFQDRCVVPPCSAPRAPSVWSAVHALAAHCCDGGRWQCDTAANATDCVAKTSANVCYGNGNAIPMIDANGVDCLVWLAPHLSCCRSRCCCRCRRSCGSGR